ncbi:unnamed protein product [Darwinula stevensoni]|uniref:Prokaryotic-type class I peptide chain release factors domain-containing protein n=1 Tax=Darwinula stevensoni TaxID=69355 RepID=A0A7R8X4S4_9CRUS|nr:unnamed protein product [Darwinula stevensoni]CAG0879820.1 unnamed protein product [Darwinula stevensoni]
MKAVMRRLTIAGVQSFWKCQQSCLRSFSQVQQLPPLKEEEIEEKFVKGNGPGGQSVNKTVNCVHLKHTPTGIVVKCHQSRLLHENRKLARQLLREKLDDFYNGEMSGRNQRKKLLLEKFQRREDKASKLRDMKEQWKNHENGSTMQC